MMMMMICRSSVMVGKNDYLYQYHLLLLFLLQYPLRTYLVFEHLVLIVVCAMS